MSLKCYLEIGKRPNLNPNLKPMFVKLCLSYSVAVIIILSIPIVMINNTYAQKPEETLDWKIETNKQAFYPGEPVLLTLNIKNSVTQQEKVDFGTDGIEAFSMKICDSNNNIIYKGGKIKRYGLARRTTIEIDPNEIAQKSIVLNQWCSTLLPHGKYKIICQIEYRLRSESTKRPGTEPTLHHAGPIHLIQLEYNIEIVEPNPSKYKEILDNMVKYEIENKEKPFQEWHQEREIAREMIIFSEWKSSVPYQLQVLMAESYTWLKKDAINSIAKSNTLEAANGLMPLTDKSSFEDVKADIIEAVYKLRETGRIEIMNATKDFVLSHERPTTLAIIAD